MTMPLHEVDNTFWNGVFLQNIFVALLLFWVSINPRNQDVVRSTFRALAYIWCVGIFYFEIWPNLEPTYLSLTLVIIGAVLCFAASRINSRFAWSTGVFLLSVAAIKLVFFDFGSLDQIGSIIAMILSGVVFMGLAWVAPIPPKTKTATPKEELKSTTAIRPISLTVSHFMILLAVVVVSCTLYLLYYHSFYGNAQTKAVVPSVVSTVWFQSTPPAQSISLAGHWKHSSYSTSIYKKNSGYLFCNENNNCQYGYYSSDHFIVVPNWEVTGLLNEHMDSIKWSNGTIWRRQ